MGGFNLPGDGGRLLAGSDELLAAKWVHSGLIYRDPWLLLPLLLPVFLAFCSLLDFLPEGWVRAVERTHCHRATSPWTAWLVEERLTP